MVKDRDGLQSPIAKNPHDATIVEILKRSGTQDGDILFLGAGRTKIVNDAMGAPCLEAGHSDFAKSTGLSESAWKPSWVIDFLTFEYDEEDTRWVAVHYPLTNPKDEYLEHLETDPGECIAKVCGMVLSGWEVGDDSVRIYRKEMQNKVSRVLKINDEEVCVKFGFLLDVLWYGAPPHGGIASGLDHIVTMMVDADSIHGVIAFPKT